MRQQPYQDELLLRHLRTYLGDIDEAAMTLLREQLEWVEVGAGQTLMAQGEPGDAMYLSISGRLRAYVRDSDGHERFVREMARGQVIGEMALFTNEPRSATVVAIRDSVLVRLDKAAFTQLLGTSAQVAVALTRHTIQRLQSLQARPELARPVAMSLVPVSAGVDAAALAASLSAQLARWGRVCVVDAAALDAAAHEPGLARQLFGDAERERRIALALDEIEAAHDYLLLLADDQATPWTQRCCRRGDELLLLANATQPPALHPSEQQFLMHRPGRAEAAEVLLLLHPDTTACPRDTAAWLDRRPVADHLHLRPGQPRDMARLARVQSRNAVGLVLAGGGARGIAHLGVYRALREHGIEVDFVGGTSIGSVMATLIGANRPPAELTAIARRAFSVNPTGDFNPVPLLSLIRGQRLRRVMDKALHELVGFEARAEDLWKNWYCVASNYSQAREQLITRGPLLKAVRASIAIPGALPPVLHEGDLLCDGGTFNNFPVDVMRNKRGVGQVIGVDLSFRKPRRFDHAEVPSAWALLRDRLRPRKARRFRFPSLVAYLMNVTILYSTSRQREYQKLSDLYLNPPLERVGMLQWNKFDSIVEQGYAHANEVLAALPPEKLAALRAVA